MFGTKDKGVQHLPRGNFLLMNSAGRENYVRWKRHLPV